VVSAASFSDALLGPYGVNLEQLLADNGETGLFMRFGWNNGKAESFADTVVDIYGLRLHPEC